jgi:hypothetical protein
MPRQLFVDTELEIDWDRDRVTCLRSCMMKPEHLDWIDRIWQTFESVADRAI